MKTTWFCLSLILGIANAVSQQQKATTVSNPNIRIIEGKEYPVETLRLYQFQVLSNVTPNVLAVKVGQSKYVPRTPRAKNDPTRIGGYSPNAGPYTEYSEFAFVTNATANAPGRVSMKALKVGSHYDCGVPALSAVSTSARRDDPTFERDRSLAANEDPESLLRMGERYQVGRGVPKDMEKAREYYQRAADKGNSDAKIALKNLPK